MLVWQNRWLLLLIIMPLIMHLWRGGGGQERKKLSNLPSFLNFVYQIVISIYRCFWLGNFVSKLLLKVILESINERELFVLFNIYRLMYYFADVIKSFICFIQLINFQMQFILFFKVIFNCILMQKYKCY